MKWSMGVGPAALGLSFRMTGLTGDGVQAEMGVCRGWRLVAALYVPLASASPGTC